ncbi:MAG: hypothetical protein ABR598_05125 [Candidatus Dormibacteria bacterium]
MVSDTDALRPRLAALAAVAALGAVDVGAFIATQPGTALKTGGRATGSLAGLAVWLLLLGVSGKRLAAVERGSLSRATVTLGALAAAGGVGLAAIHQLAGVGGIRTIGGGVLGLAALGLAIASRRPSPG